jgi:site-specific DNA recombinase
MRVAIYARYLSERQNDRSIQDQIAECARHASKQGWEATETFTDAAISGFAMNNRPGLLSALAAAESSRFEVLLCEDEDRIARNLEHLAHVVNRLRFAGVRLATLSNPEVDTMHVAFKGLIAEDYLRNVAQKTSRGMRANAEKGLATGSRLYGYRSQPGGAIEIVPEEAEIIRYIFAEYASGASPKAIAQALNRRSVPSPRGGDWNASTINGSRQRRNGILQSDLYAGTKVWNRWLEKKNPANGRRTVIIKPKSEWRTTPVPHLRIVDQETWDAAQQRKARYSALPLHHQPKRPAWLLAGLVKCGVCGGAMTTATSSKLRCVTRVNRGLEACSNRRSVPREQVEERVLAALKSKLLSPEAMRYYVRMYHQAWEEKRAAELSARQPMEKRLAELRRRLTRAIDELLDGTPTPELRRSIMDMDAEKCRLEEQLAVMAEPTPVVRLHPNAAEGYGRNIEELSAAIAVSNEDPVERDRVVRAIRSLIESVVITPESEAPRAKIRIEFFGKISALLDVRQADGTVCTELVVVGGGIEPPTCGL